MSILHDPGANRLADLEHFDEPAPEDADDLDLRTLRHIAALIAQHEGDDDEEDPDWPPDEDPGDDEGDEETPDEDDEDDADEPDADELDAEGRLVVRIYRPTIRLFERMEDGEWDPKGDPFTLTLFEPMPDEDRVIAYPRPARDLRKVVTGGSEPAHELLVPGGDWLAGKDGRRYLRTAACPALDPLEAFIRARRQLGDVAFAAQARAASATEAPTPTPAAPARPAGPAEVPPRDGPDEDGPAFRLEPPDPAARRRRGRPASAMAGDAPGWKGARHG